jgi:hypothetical protein
MTDAFLAKKGLDLEAVKTFYDPHPGFQGAAIPIPEPVRLVAVALNGTALSLREAAARLQTATKGSIAVEDGFIGLRLGRPGGPVHYFRVIRYR